MKLTQQWKWTKFVLVLILIVLVISILFLPLGLRFLTVPEQVFVISLLVFSILYSKVLGAYYFVNRLLSMIENDEDIFDYVKDKLSKNTLIKYLLEWDLLVLAETQLLKAKEIWGLLFDISLVYMLILFIGNLVGILPDFVFYSAVISPMLLVILVWFIDMYVDYKFVRIFLEELKDFEQIAKSIYIENQNEVEELKEDAKVEDVNNKDNR